MPLEKIASFESGIRSFLASNKPELARKIEDVRQLNEEIEGELRETIAEFKETVPY